MYPQALLLGIAALRGDLGIRSYALPLSVIGWLVALYQNLETWGVVPVLRACTSDPSSSCGTPWPVWGANSPLNTVLTIPVLSMIAFTVIIGLLSWRRTRTF
jgi:disulfide bond formation protein DsbB